MHAREEDLIRCLDALGIVHNTHRHDPVYTVEEGRHLHESMPGGHSKNLFLKDKKGVFLLAVMEAERKVDLKALVRADAVPGGRLSFARADYVRDMLGVEPGSVTPFVMMNETARGVTLILDKALTDMSPVNFHPLHNAATTAIAPCDLLRFLNHCGVRPIILDFETL